MLREVVALAVLEHKQAALVEQVTFHDYVGHLRQLLQSIGRVGKDEIEALATARQIAEHISTHGECLLGLQLVDEAAYEAKVKRIVLYRHHMATSPAEQFERDAAGAREEVQCRGSLIEINITLQDIEEIFLCKVRRGTGLEGAGDVETASLVFSSDYAHTSTCSI